MSHFLGRTQSVRSSPGTPDVSWFTPCPSCHSVSVECGLPNNSLDGIFDQRDGASRLFERREPPRSARCRRCGHGFDDTSEPDSILQELLLGHEPSGPLAGSALVRSIRGARAAALRRAVQAVLLSHDRFETSSAAARWVRDHEFRADRPDHGIEWGFEQKQRGEGPWRSIPLESGVRARLESADV